MSEKKLSKFVHLMEIKSLTEPLRVASPGIASGDPATASMPQSSH